MARAFIIRPFGKKKDSAGKEVDFELVQEELINPALVATQLSGRTTTEIGFNEISRGGHDIL